MTTGEQKDGINGQVEWNKYIKDVVECEEHTDRLLSC